MADKRPLPWWSGPRAIVQHLLMLDDTPHAIALGTSIGVFIGMTPTIGVQMLLVLLVSLMTGRLFYFSLPAALIAVYISNPITALPIYWLGYQVGRVFLDGDLKRETLASSLEFDGLRQFWDSLHTLFVDIGGPLVLGSVIVGAASAAIAYPLVWQLLRRCQRASALHDSLASSRQELTAHLH